MAIHKFEKLLEGQKIAIGANIFFPCPMSGKLKSVRLIGVSGGFTGSWQFDLRYNGAYLFSAGRLILTPSDVDDAKTGLTVSVVEGLPFVLELVIPGPGVMFSPLTVICEIEDGLAPGVAGEYAFPLMDGTNGQVPTTDGSGVVTWQTPAGGGGSGDTIAPATNTDNFIPQWNGANSKTLKDGLQLDTDTALAADSDTRIASQKAVKTYVDAEIAAIPGGGDVAGPAGGVVDGEIVVYQSTTGKIVKASGSVLATVLSSIAAKVVGAGTVVTDRIVLFSSTTGLAIKQSAFGEALLTALDAFKTAFAGGSQYQVFRKTSGTDFAGAWAYSVEHITIAVSDETTDLATGTGKVTFRMPYAFFLQEVRINVNTAPTGATIICDLNEAGATVFTTNPSIDASEKTSTTAATAAVISDANLADDAEMTIDIDQIGSSVKGKGLKMTLIGYRK